MNKTTSINQKRHANLSKKSKKIILDTRHENKTNKTGFAILLLSSKKFYNKPFSAKA